MNYPAIDAEAVGIFDAPNLTGTPERRLLLAVLERALLDYVGNDSEEVRIAEEWIFQDEESDEGTAFSFSWICKELDLDVQDIRRKVRAMPKRGASRIAPWYLTKEYGKSRRVEKQGAEPKGRGKVLDFCSKN